jgi:hypothetical protein
MVSNDTSVAERTASRRTTNSRAVSSATLPPEMAIT